MDRASANIKRIGVAGVSGRTCHQQRGDCEKPFHGNLLSRWNLGVILTLGLNRQRDVGHARIISRGPRMNGSTGAATAEILRNDVFKPIDAVIVWQAVARTGASSATITLTV